jgi:hypothetical protein
MEGTWVQILYTTSMSINVVKQIVWDEIEMGWPIVGLLPGRA